MWLVGSDMRQRAVERGHRDNGWVRRRPTVMCWQVCVDDRLSGNVRTIDRAVRHDLNNGFFTCNHARRRRCEVLVLEHAFVSSVTSSSGIEVLTHNVQRLLSTLSVQVQTVSPSFTSSEFPESAGRLALQLQTART